MGAIAVNGLEHNLDINNRSMRGVVNYLMG